MARRAVSARYRVETGLTWSVRRFLARVNWTLVFGVVMVLITLAVAVNGARWAPLDPNVQYLIVHENDQYFSSPIPAFTVASHPLGTDQLGRDLYSQLLWAVRPTLILVSIAATVRLLAGILLGLAAGWTSGRVGRTLDSLISFALATPVFIVSLAVVAAFSVEGSLQAFVLGLSLTGWAETARIIRSQTRHIKGQLYIEAALSMGASDLGILVRHVLRQVMSMIWMLFSFEIGSTLLVTASLGFLGYYIGGDAFVFTGDTTLQRTGEVPELGQMLATSWISLVEPWGLFATGLAILFIVLGFNLLAEGLSRRLSLESAARNTWASRLWGAFSGAVESNITYPLGNWWRTRAPRRLIGTAFGVGVIGLAAYGILPGLFAPVERISAEAVATVPGNQQWASRRHDPFGSYYTTALGPQDTPEIIWRFTIQGAFNGGPVVGADGTIYAVDTGGRIYAIDPETGTEIWHANLDRGINPVNGITLGANGELFIADDHAGVSAFSSEGDFLWYFSPRFNNNAIAEAVVAPDGNIFFATDGGVQAVSPLGDELWFTVAKPNLRRVPPKVSGDGLYVFVDDIAIRIADGERVNLTEVSDAVATDSTRFARTFYEVNPAGETFIQARNLLVPWHTDEAGLIQIDGRRQWEQSLTVLGEANWQGITPDGIFWQLFTAFGSIQDTTLHWLDADGRVLSSVQFVQRPAIPMGVDASNTLYTCGSNPNLDSQVECAAWPAGEKEARWRLTVDPVTLQRFVSGGAVVEGRIYLTAQHFSSGRAYGGILFALGNPAEPVFRQEAEPILYAGMEGEPLDPFSPPAVQAPAYPDLSVLDGLSIEDFFEVSYDLLVWREPELITSAGVSDLMDTGNALLTPLNPAYQAETQQLRQAIFERLTSYERESLTQEQQISYDIYTWWLDDLIRGAEFAYYDYPLNYLFGVHTALGDMLLYDHPLNDRQDVEDYITRLSQVKDKWEGFVAWLDAQEAAGVIMPDFLLDIAAGQINDYWRGSPTEHVLYVHLKDAIRDVPDLTAPERRSYLEGAAIQIEASVIPGYLALREKIDELRSHAGSNPAVSQFPQGADFYAYILQHHTTTTMTPEEIHALGLREVARIQAEIRAVFDQLGYPADESLAESFERVYQDGGVLIPGAPGGATEVLDEYERLISEAEANLDGVFDLRPQADVVVVAVPPENAGAPGGYYISPALDGSRPGQFFANINRQFVPRFDMPTLAYHEAVPGHHFQIAIQQELDLPSFRRYEIFTAYAEGWGLYAERLAYELGWYDDDPYGNLGRLQGELFRAARLVVDTGMHSMGWSRQQARQFMDNNLGYPFGAMNNEIDRYISWPGQATSYLIGMLEIVDLREEARQQLGDKFDLAEFHNVVLGNGSMPLEVLRAVVQNWVAEKLAGP